MSKGPQKRSNVSILAHHICHKNPTNTGQLKQGVNEMMVPGGQILQLGLDLVSENMFQLARGLPTLWECREGLGARSGFGPERICFIL